MIWETFDDNSAGPSCWQAMLEHPLQTHSSIITTMNYLRQSVGQHHKQKTSREAFSPPAPSAVFPWWKTPASALPNNWLCEEQHLSSSLVRLSENGELHSSLSLLQLSSFLPNHELLSLKLCRGSCSYSGATASPLLNLFLLVNLVLLLLLQPPSGPLMLKSCKVS